MKKNKKKNKKKDKNEEKQGDMRMRKDLGACFYDSSSHM